jgi:hypothetical protein
MARGENNPGGHLPREPEPFPGSWAGRRLTDDEVHELGHTHRDAEGYWVNLEGCRSGGSTLTPKERAARDRQSQRARHALRNPTHITNPDAMADALKDAFGGRLTIGGIRRGERFSNALESFDWDAVRRRVDAQHADAIDRIENPTRSQQHSETRRSFSVLENGQQPGRTRSRTEKSDRAYGIAVLDAECWRVAETPPGNRNNVLASAAFKVGSGAVGPGFVDHNEAYSNLLGAALACGLPEREARAVIRKSLPAGARRPRPMRLVNETPA